MRDPGGVGSRNLDPTSGYIDQLIVGSGRKEIVDFIPGLAIITTSGIDGDAVEGDILHRCIRGFHRQNSRGDTNAAVDVNGKGDVFENQIFQLRGFQRQEQSGLLAGVGIDFSAGQPDNGIAAVS